MRQVSFTIAYGKFTDEEFQKFTVESDVYKSICSKIAPSIFGHDDVKKVVACLLFGGSRKVCNGLGCLTSIIYWFLLMLNFFNEQNLPDRVKR